MNPYLLIKYAHILSATILFGTGVGIAFFKWTTDRSRNVQAIHIANERTVLADWLFTTPAVIAQPVTGIALLHIAGYSMTTGWVFYTFCFYAVAICCWLPVVWLQLSMRNMSRIAVSANTPLPIQYWQYTRIWFGLGIPAFIAFIIIYWLMVFKPAI